MDELVARALLASLLERLSADARKEVPQFEGVVSASERQALKILLGRASSEPESPAPAVAPSTEDSGDPEPQEESAAPTVRPVEAAVEASAPPIPGPRRSEAKLDETALSMQKPTDSNHVLCLDFGTAKSKAFAASVEQDENPDPLLLELGLGRQDGDIDGSAYTVSSSVWISDEGLVFVGSQALRHSMNSYSTGTHRRRLDSLKQQLTLAGGVQNLSSRRLEPEINPTKVDLTYEDALSVFLAYLTDLALTELSVHGYSRYIKRRFTIPSWQPAQRAWASAALAKCVARGQLLADTFRGRWKDGIPADELKSMISAASAHDLELRYLLDGCDGAGGSFPSGLLEPLAAGSGRIWADNAARNLVLVVDVGAGTTDFSLFWVVQNTVNDTRKAFPVAPGSDAIRMAGDILDDILLNELLSQTHGSASSSMRPHIETALRLRGLRRLKEQMFVNGKLEVTLVTDQIVSIELEDFLRNERVEAVGKELEKAIARFLGVVHTSFSGATDNALVVLTGGGARLPMIKALRSRPWDIAGRRIVFKQTPEVPELITRTFDADFQREYPQLAVAIGGALPVLDEKDTLREWQGGSTRSASLERYPVTGR